MSLTVLRSKTRSFLSGPSAMTVFTKMRACNILHGSDQDCFTPRRAVQTPSNFRCLEFPNFFVWYSSLALELPSVDRYCRKKEDCSGRTKLRVFGMIRRKEVIWRCYRRSLVQFHTASRLSRNEWIGLKYSRNFFHENDRDCPENIEGSEDWLL